MPILPDSVMIDINGVSARTWPFQPNWRQNVDLTLTFNTDLITSRSGREQRRALRSTPRRELQYTVTLSHNETRTLHRLLTIWQSRLWAIPDPLRRVVCSGGALSGATQVGVDTFVPWMATGQVVLFGDDVLATIESADQNTNLLTLTAALDGAVAAGAFARPVLSGRLNAKLEARHPSSAVSEARITLDVTPGSEPLDEGQPSYSVFSGREVFLSKPNWGNDVRDTFSWESENVDFDFGVIATYNFTEFGTMIRQETFVCETTTDVDYITRFFARQRGRRGEFLKPTWLNDLPPVADLESGTNYIRVAGTHVATDYDGDAIYQSVAVILRDGTRLYRQVSSLETIEDGDGDDSLIHFTATWSSDIPVEDVLMVSWMPVTRFSTDALTIQYLTDQIAQIQISTQTLEYLPAEDPLPILEPTALRFDSTLVRFDSTMHTMDEA